MNSPSQGTWEDSVFQYGGSLVGECSHCRLRAQVQILFTISSSGRRSLLRVNVSVRRDILGETGAILKRISSAGCSRGNCLQWSPSVFQYGKTIRFQWSHALGWIRSYHIEASLFPQIVIHREFVRTVDNRRCFNMVSIRGWEWNKVASHNRCYDRGLRKFLVLAWPLSGKDAILKHISGWVRFAV